MTDPEVQFGWRRKQEQWGSQETRGFCEVEEHIYLEKEIYDQEVSQKKNVDVL